MDNYQKALQAFCDTLACKSGGGVNSSSSEPITPQDVAGLALFLRDGRVAAFGVRSASADPSPKPGFARPTGGGQA